MVRKRVADEDEMCLQGPIGEFGSSPDMVRDLPVWEATKSNSFLAPPRFLAADGEGGLGEEVTASGARSTATGSRMLQTNAGGHGTTSDRPSSPFLFSFLTDDDHPRPRPLCDLTISIAPVRQTEVLPVA